MTSATPTRPAQERSPLVVIGLVALAAIVVVALLVWAFVASGLAGRIGAWMHDTTIGSLKINLRRSEKGCNTPQGPTTLGPRRNCTAAQTFRSA